MEQSKFERVLRKIYATQDSEISCSECFDRVSDYVDLELAGKDAAKDMPSVAQHLDECQVCREEYETLLELARITQQDRATP